MARYGSRVVMMGAAIRVPVSMGRLELKFSEAVVKGLRTAGLSFQFCDREAQTNEVLVSAFGV